MSLVLIHRINSLPLALDILGSLDCGEATLILVLEHVPP